LRAHLHGNGQWDDLWETLTHFAERFDLSAIQLNVHLPAHGEEYHASWNRSAMPAEGQLWHSDIPLIVQHVTVGRLRITGACSNGSVCVWMSDLIAGLKPFETQMIELLEDVRLACQTGELCELATRYSLRSGACWSIGFTVRTRILQSCDGRNDG
jgi:hypothetical protein